MALLQGGELLQGQRVDGAEDAQLALELAGPGRRRGALGQRRALGGHGHGRLDVVLAAQRLHGGLQAQAGLGLVELHPAGLLAHLLQPALGVGPLAAVTVELGGGGPHLLALAVALLGKVVVLGVEHDLVAGHDLVQPVEGGERGLEPEPPLRGVGPGVLVGQQALLDLGEALLRGTSCRSASPAARTAELGDGGRATPPARSSNSVMACWRARACSASASSSASSPGSTASSSATRDRSRASRSPHLAGAGGHDVGLGGQLAPLGLRPGQPLGGRGERGRR